MLHWAGGADPLAALLMVFFLVHEGSEAIEEGRETSHEY